MANATVVVGLGPSEAGWFERFNVDAGAFSAIDWGQVTADGYSSRPDASTVVCTGDVDGDGKDEIVVGTGASGQGRVYVYKNYADGAKPSATLQISG